jgi:hypothetical protein
MRRALCLLVIFAEHLIALYCTAKVTLSSGLSRNYTHDAYFYLLQPRYFLAHRVRL